MIVRYCVPTPGALVLVALLAACPKVDGGRAAAPGDAGALFPEGIRVALPEGWRARAGEGGLLLVGLPGRDILRLERLPDGPLPDAGALGLALADGLEGQGGARSKVVAQACHADECLVRFTAAWGTGERRKEWSLAVVVRRVGGKRLACATLPLASEAEVEAGVSVCQTASNLD